MINAKQKNIRIFEIEIDNKSEFIEYIKKNLILLQRFVLMLRGNIDEEISDFLISNKIEFGILNQPLLKEKTKENTEIKQDTNVQHIEKEHDDKKLEESIILDRTIRSGEVIEVDSDLLITGRINGGAIIKCEKNIVIYDEIDGKVICEGNFAFIHSIGKGSLLFHGEVFDNTNLNGKNKMIYKNQEKIEVR